MCNRIELTNSHIAVIDPTPTEHPILDKALFEILDTARPRKLKYWINTLIYKKYMAETGHYLVRKGVLVRKKKRLCLVISYGDHQEGLVTAKYDLKNHLRDIVLAGQPLELREKLLLADLYHSRLLKLVFRSGERKVARKRIKKLMLEDNECSSLSEAMNEIVEMACQEWKKA